MRYRSLIAGCIMFVLSTPLIAQQSAAPGSPLIDFDGFRMLSAEVAPYRKQRLIKLTEFQSRAAQTGALLLDARSAQAFAEGHIAGAVNLPLPDFTAGALAELIGDNPDREILIYCNNNFRNNIRPVVTKALPLALNISTFINLYGYGYRNVYELGEAVDMVDPKVGWVPAAVPQAPISTIN